MEYLLKNGKKVVIRTPVEGDAENLIALIAAADGETPFLARNPGEFQTSVEQEKSIIADIRSSTQGTWFVAECQGKLVGQCSVGRVRALSRYQHRAEVAFLVLADYCDMGIGGRLMEECLRWCRENQITQVELGVVTTNERAFAMYKNFGFEVMGTIPNALCYLDGTSVDEYQMVKFL